jgi:hypothetical protein
MQRGDSFPALVLAAILAFGAAVAYGLHRVSADVAAVAVLSVSATLACVVATVLHVVEPWSDATISWLKQFRALDDIGFCASASFDAGTEKK